MEGKRVRGNQVVEKMPTKIVRVSGKEWYALTDGTVILITNHHLEPLWRIILHPNGDYVIVPVHQSYGGVMYISRQFLKEIIDTIKKVRGDKR